MKEIAVKAYAKINLCIDVLGKRPDGYHEILTVMEQIDLVDFVTVSWTAGNQDIEVCLKSNMLFLPSDSRNIAYKAAELMIHKYGSYINVRRIIDKHKETAERNPDIPKEDVQKFSRININITKRIPVAAGLAGGSANCAAVLHALNRLWNLNLDLKTLMEIGTELGADVPFCLAGQAALNEHLMLSKDALSCTCALAFGIGEKLEPLPSLKALILLSKPPINVSTAQVYGGLDFSDIKEHPNIQELTAGLRENNYHKITKNMINVLENYSLNAYPVILDTKNIISREGSAAKVLMSGSGPTVFGLYTSKKNGKTAFSKLKKINPETYLMKTL
ncbi:MAG: 4-(cytidine 5'-diphospho)-2-C-methyl-D-erythritol kinase [Eubacteriales bacterium]|nr:4-(cytidine 5'-diphospho)-2-C-methyl-D-erythritol kinase [Eubacteriales bacterium]